MDALKDMYNTMDGDFMLGFIDNKRMWQYILGRMLWSPHYLKA